MKEFIEKLIERLEEESSIYSDCIGGYRTELSAIPTGIAKKIVNQLAEEYKGKEVLNMAQVSADYAKARLEELKRISNNGWSPCSEPPKCFMLSDGSLIPFLVCDNVIWHPYIAFFDGKEWRTGVSKIEPIAWQRLPEPFRPKGE